MRNSQSLCCSGQSSGASLTKSFWKISHIGIFSHVDVSLQTLLKAVFLQGCKIVDSILLLIYLLFQSGLFPNPFLPHLPSPLPVEPFLPQSPASPLLFYTVLLSSFPMVTSEFPGTHRYKVKYTKTEVQSWAAQMRNNMLCLPGPGLLHLETLFICLFHSLTSTFHSLIFRYS